MSPNMKTPGVYIQELDAFGNSVVPVATAIPVFIGYTELTSSNGESLLNKAIKINSLAEFLDLFGKQAPKVKYKITSTFLPNIDKESSQAKVSNEDDMTGLSADFKFGNYTYTVKSISVNYRLYAAMKFFYQNGGNVCYVMSIGGYDYSKQSITDIGVFTDAISILEKEIEPTILVIPDAIEVLDTKETDSMKPDYLKNRYSDAYELQLAMINHCGKMTNRVAILDVPGGFSEKTSVAQFRESVEPEVSKYKSYAVAYYPWLHTSVYQSSEVGFHNFHPASYDQVKQMLEQEFVDKNGDMETEIRRIVSQFSESPDTSDPAIDLDKADSILKNISKSYQLLLKTIIGSMNLLAPSSGMAGIYTAVDNSDGVWKAPANIGVQSTIMPSIKIDNEMQQDLNNPLSGKSICAIRLFPGLGTLVWGARTLDGNSNDWRYINVRRTLIYIEQSVKVGAQAYVFESNDASTWTKVSSMISTFLTGLWNQGGLAGSNPADAFSVMVGLGSTMTNDDILNGIMRVSVKVAVTRPAEFIEITFQQQMQKA